MAFRKRADSTEGETFPKPLKLVEIEAPISVTQKSSVQSAPVVTGNILDMDDDEVLYATICIMNCYMLYTLRNYTRADWLKAITLWRHRKYSERLFYKTRTAVETLAYGSCFHSSCYNNFMETRERFLFIKKYPVCSRSCKFGRTRKLVPSRASRAQI